MTAVELESVQVRQDGARLLGELSWRLADGDHAVVLGPNGAGKTTLLRVLSGYRHPTAGRARVLSRTLGRTDVRELRRHVGLVSTGIDDLLEHGASARELVAAGALGATRSVGAAADPDAAARAEEALARVGAGALADRRCGTLSQGEWQRVQIARALVGGVDLLLLDEPMAGLDVGGRERLLGDLSELMGTAAAPTVVLVTHHLEEIPPPTARALLLADGRRVAAGPVDEVLTADTLEATFGVRLAVTRTDGRFSARRTDG